MLGLEDLKSSDKIKKKQKQNGSRCLILALVSLPLNDPRRLCIGIFSSSRSVYLYYYYIHFRFNHGTYQHAYSSRKVED